MCCDDRISLCHLAKPFAQLMNFIKLVYGLCFLIDTDYGVINVSLRFLSTIFLSSFFFIPASKSLTFPFLSIICFYAYVK